MFGHRLNVPHLVGLLFKSIGPFPAQTRGYRPAECGTPQTHANQMSLGGPVVDKAITTVKNGQVVDEVNVTGLGGELELSGASDGFDGIQGFNLLCVKSRQASLAGVSSRSQERSTAKIHDKLATLVK